MSTVLVQQRSGSDCTLACIAMAAGKPWDDLWSQSDIDELVANKGCGDEEPYMVRAGFTKNVDYKRFSMYDTLSQPDLKRFLWKRRAMLSVPSLNTENGSHHVYWDGESLFDPSTKKTYAYLSSVFITNVIIFSA